MLRDYEYTENWRLIDKALEQFIELPERLSLVGYVSLSPDSFLWKIFDGETFYYLYAEDYIPNYEAIPNNIAEFASKGAKFTFVPVKKRIAFEDSSPNTHAQVYQPPEDEYEFAKYAGQSGYDFVFLLTSDEKLTDFESSKEVQSSP